MNKYVSTYIKLLKTVFGFTAIFRVHLTIMEPYTKDYADMKSEAFEWLANNITLSLNEALKQYGTYSPRVVAIQ